MNDSHLFLRKNWVCRLKCSLYPIGLLFALSAGQAFAAAINLHIVSDNTWRSSDTAPVGWEQVAFNDSAWSNARAPYPNDRATPGGVLPGTLAQFMWHDPLGTSDGQRGPNEVFLRKTFTLNLAADSLPILGQALIDADDDFEFFVNGARVILDASGGLNLPPKFVDFTSKLVTGLNVFAVHAVDGGFEGVDASGNPIGHGFGNILEWVLVDSRIVTVPEPLTSLLLLTGCIGLLRYGRRQKRVG